MKHYIRQEDHTFNLQQIDEQKERNSLPTFINIENSQKAKQNQNSQKTFAFDRRRFSVGIPQLKLKQFQIRKSVIGHSCSLMQPKNIFNKHYSSLDEFLFPKWDGEQLYNLENGKYTK